MRRKPKKTWVLFIQSAVVVLVDPEDLGAFVEILLHVSHKGLFISYLALLLLVGVAQVVGALLHPYGDPVPGAKLHDPVVDSFWDL